MAIEVDLVRHGESIFNALGIYQGASQDSSLSETGIRQAENLARKLALRNYAGIYSSPLKRALNTARIIRQKQPHPPLIYTEEWLKELDHGDIGSMRVRDIKKNYPNEWDLWKRAPAKTSPHFPGGQILPQEAEMACKRLNFLISLWGNGSKILIVSHGAKIKIIVMKILNCLPSFHSLVIKNCGLITLSFSEKMPCHGRPPIYDIKVLMGENFGEDVI